MQTREVRETVENILTDIQRNGDAAVKKYEERFGNSSRPLRVSEEEIEERLRELPEDVKAMIDVVVERIADFAKAQLACIQPLEREFGPGIRMGHRIVPVEKVGAYIPGGRFPLLSSGPMVVVPAKVAGAKQIVACSPANYKGGIHPAVLYGLKKAGATDIFAIGGAQAIGAMAYGTESVPQVDVIAGPGNRYVAEAKRQVFGQVGIDLIAGPSEVLVFADAASDPLKCAADLLAQAEHDPNARAILVTTSRQNAEQTMQKVEELLKEFSENSPAHASWENNGEVVLADSLEEGIAICNDYAIEHLHVHVQNAEQLLEKFTNYGSIFLGEDSSVVFSDKVSGTNHTLPTLRAARYTGGLWVGNFVKVITHQQITGEGVRFLAKHADKQSEIEGLEGHKLSAFLRL
jgi:histidinol dehydrogenase/sulfopropanediol 3-dehydrogenase